MASENGRGLPVGTLPGTKYWAYQLGATDEMVKDQENSIKAKKTDFVVINDWHPGISKRDRFVRASGYKLIYQYSWHDVNFNLYSKHDNLLLPPTDFHVSNMDVLLKRNIFNK